MMKKNHEYKKQYDERREKTIKESKECVFVRIKEDESVGTAIAKLVKHIS